MKNFFRRTLVFLLSAGMVFSLGGMTAMATEVEEDDPAVSVEGSTGDVADDTYTVVEDETGDISVESEDAVEDYTAVDDMETDDAGIQTLAVTEGLVAFAVYSEDDGTLTFYTDEAAPEAGGTYKEKAATGVYENVDTLEASSTAGIPWYSIRSTTTTVVFDASFAEAQPVSLAYWFYGSAATTYTGLEYLDTSQVTSMANMFQASAAVSLDLSGFKTSKVTSIRRMFYQCASLTSLDVSGWDLSSLTTMADLFTGCTSLTKADLSSWGKTTGGITTLASVFDGCTSLVSADLTGLDTSSVTSLQYLFRDCSSLTDVNLSGLDTGKVTGMSYMFSNCASLTEADLSGLNTSAVTNMSYLFRGCTSLTNVNLSGLDTAKATNMSHMFENCASLKTLDLSDLNTEKVTAGTSTTSFATGCTDLQCVVLGANTNIFSGRQLVDQATWYDSPTNGNVVSTSYLGDAAYPGTYYSSTVTVKDPTAFAVYSADDNSLTFCVDAAPDEGETYNGKTATAVYDNVDSLRITSIVGAPWYGIASDVTSVVIDESFADAQPTNLYAWFYSFANASFRGLENIDTSDVTIMAQMFNGCAKLTEADVSDWDVSSVTDMHSMFYGCESLASLDLSDWDVSNVTDISSLFSACESLESVDVSGWDTSNATAMNLMFNGCKSLTDVDLSGWGDKSGKVTNMNQMFNRCTSLETLDLSGLNTTAVKTYSNFAVNCTFLQYVSLGANTDIFTKAQNVDQQIWYDSDVNGNIVSEDYLQTAAYPGEYWTYTKVSGAFAVYSADDNSLTFYVDVSPDEGETYNGKTATAVYTDVDSLTLTSVEGAPWYSLASDITSVVIDESFADAQPTSLYAWFYHLSNATFSGLENIDTSNVTDMGQMFNGCTSLTEADLSAWDTSNVTSTHSMFAGCTALTCVDVTGWDTSNVTDMSSMFSRCASLTDIEGMADWDVSGVTTVEMMFYNCASLETLDLSGWDTTGISSPYTNYDRFATGCTSLKHVVLGENTDIFAKRQNVDQQIWYDSDVNGNIVSEDYLQDAAYPGEYWTYTTEVEEPVITDVTITAEGLDEDNTKTYDGESVTLTVDATVTPDTAEVTYQWYKDGVAIDGATESTLTLAGEVSDSGTYTCEVTATNDGLSVTETAEITITITEPEATVDKSALQAEVDVDVLLNEEDFTPATWAPFAEALAKAQSVLDDPDATQEEVDEALKDLQNAKVNLVFAADKSDLQSLVDEAEALNESDYTADSWAALQAALEKAKAVLDDPNATQDEVDEALLELKTAMDNLETVEEAKTTDTKGGSGSDTGDGSGTGSGSGSTSGTSGAKTADTNVPILYVFLIAFAGAVIVTFSVRRRTVRR